MLLGVKIPVFSLHGQDLVQVVSSYSYEGEEFSIWTILVYVSIFFALLSKVFCRSVLVTGLSGRNQRYGILVHISFSSLFWNGVQTR